METADSVRETADELLERARSNPVSVDTTLLVETLTSGDRRARQHAARAYTLTMEADPLVAEDTARELLAVLENGSGARRNMAALTIAQLADRHPDVYASAVPLLLEIVRREFDPARNNSLRALAKLASDHPDDVCRGLPALVKLLDEDLVGRVRALQVLHPLSECRPSRVGDHLQDVLAPIGKDELTTTDEGSRETAPFQGPDRKNEQSLSYSQWNYLGRIVGNVASDDPDVLFREECPLRSFLTAESTDVCSKAVHVLSIAAPKAPGAIAPVVEELARVVSGDYPPETRFHGSLALCGIGIESPGLVSGVVDEMRPELGELLEAEDPCLKGAAVGIFAIIAEADSTAEIDRTDEIRRLLHDDIAYVRANAALVAGYIGDNEALPILRTLSEEDSDEEVRGAAIEALSEFESAERRHQ